MYFIYMSLYMYKKFLINKQCIYHLLRKDKYIVVYLHNGILHNDKNGWTIALHKNMDEYHMKMLSRSQKSNTISYMPQFYVCKFKNRQNNL